MKLDFKGIENSENKISVFVDYLEKIKENSLWIYKGLKVEIDPTIDFTNSNILIRWTDIDEGFNDKIIYHNLAEFKKDFQLLNA